MKESTKQGVVPHECTNLVWKKYVVDGSTEALYAGPIRVATYRESFINPGTYYMVIGLPGIADSIQKANFTDLGALKWKLEEIVQKWFTITTKEQS